MGLYRENGQRITKAAFQATTVTDPPKRITETPAGAAGVVSVVLVDEVGNVTKTSGFTYTA